MSLSSAVSQRQQKPQSDFNGIGLGAAIADVRYRMGSPDGVLAEFGKLCNGQFLFWTSDHSDETSMPKKAKDTDFDDWFYGTTSNYRIVRFRAGRTVALECTDEATPRVCGEVFGIKTGDAEAMVRSQLGKPSTEHLSDSGHKFMRFAARNLNVRFDCNGVYSISIGEPYDPTHELEARPPPLARTVMAAMTGFRRQVSIGLV